MEIKIADGILMESSLPVSGVKEFEFTWKPNEHVILTMDGYLTEIRNVVWQSYMAVRSDCGWKKIMLRYFMDIW